MSAASGATNQQILTALHALDEPVNELKLSVTVMQEDLKRVVSMVGVCERTLRGSNGDPGMVERVRVLEREVQKIDHLDGIITGRRSDDPGILERLRNLEEFQGTLKKLIWMIAGAVTIDVVMRIWSLIVK